jgi:hypothetical protein
VFPPSLVGRKKVAHSAGRIHLASHGTSLSGFDGCAVFAPCVEASKLAGDGLW